MASAFEKAVSILLAHYQSDYDTTVPGKEFDAEVRRIVAAYTSQVRDAALEEAAKIAESDKTMDYGPHGEVWVETEAGSRIAAEIRELKEQK